MGDNVMPKLAQARQRKIGADLVLKLSDSFSTQLVSLGLKPRQARDMPNLIAVIICNDNKGSTAVEISNRLGLSRTTVENRLDLLVKKGYLTSKGTRFKIADGYAAKPLLSGERYATDIAGAIHDASAALGNYGRNDKNHKNNQGDVHDDGSAARRSKA